jgi:hypothetical protein
VDDSGVTRDTAIRALRAKNLDLSFGPDNMVTIGSAGNIETVYLPAELGVDSWIVCPGVMTFRNTGSTIHL